MMSKTRPSSSSMGATPPQRRAERVEHSQQHVRRGAEQPRGGARNAWGRKGERDGGRRSRGDEEENFFKSRPGSQKSRFSLPLQPESNCTRRIALSECYCTRRALDKTVPLRIQNRPPFLPNRIKMTQFSMGVAYVFDFSK
mgnify:CR=1 FL=1